MSHNLPGRSQEFPSIPSVLYSNPDTPIDPTTILPQPLDPEDVLVDWSKVSSFLPEEWKRSFKLHVKSIIYRYINMSKKFIEAYMSHEETHLADYYCNVTANNEIWQRFQDFWLDPELSGQGELFMFDYPTHISMMLCPQTARQDIEMIKMFRGGRDSCHLMVGELYHAQALLMEVFARYQEMLQYGSERDFELPEVPRTLDEEQWDVGIFP